MRIRIIDPSSYTADGAVARYPKIWVTGLTAIHLAALCGNHEVDVHFEVLAPVDFDAPADLVAITAMGPQLIRAIDIADEYRRRGVPVVLGGYQASLLPEYVAPHVDALVLGEAEPVWERVLADAACRRLASQYDGRGGARLAGLPVPRYDLLDRRRHSRLFPVEATRGCPKFCSYCAVADRYQTGFRPYPIEDVLRNLRAVLRQGTRDVFFVDSNFVGDFDRAKALLREVRRLDIRWTTQVTVEAGEDPELLDAMRESGCEALSIGFESINPGSLRSVAKGWSRVDRYRRVIDAVMSRGIHVNALTMFGLDEDRVDVFERTADFFAGAGVSLLDCFILVPMPGTPLYLRLRREGRLLTEDFRQYDVTRVVYRPRHMSPEELEHGLWEAFHRFYGWDSIARRMARNWRSSLSSWAALLGLNVMYRRLTAKGRAKHPNIWHAPYA